MLQTERAVGNLERVRRKAAQRKGDSFTEKNEQFAE